MDKHDNTQHELAATFAVTEARTDEVEVVEFESAPIAMDAPLTDINFGF